MDAISGSCYPGWMIAAIYPVLFLAALILTTKFAAAFVTRRDRIPTPASPVLPPPLHHHDHCCVVCNATCLPAAAALMARSNSFMRRAAAAAQQQLPFPFPPPSPTPLILQGRPVTEPAAPPRNSDDFSDDSRRNANGGARILRQRIQICGDEKMGIREDGKSSGVQLKPLMWRRIKSSSSSGNEENKRVAAAAVERPAGIVEEEEVDHRREMDSPSQCAIASAPAEAGVTKTEGTAAELAAEDGRRWARRGEEEEEEVRRGEWRGKRRRRNGRRKEMAEGEAEEEEEGRMERMTMNRRWVVACNDCVGKAKLFRSMDALHQHQWDAAEHVHVSASRTPIFGCRRRRCFLCSNDFPSAAQLERHFLTRHPLVSLTKSMWHHIAVDFHSNWKKPTVQPGEVLGIFKVYNPGWRRKAFEDYRTQLKRRECNRNRAMRSMDPEERNKILRDGNEVQLYHGTTFKCAIGQLHARDPLTMANSSPLCNDPECSLCRILQVGFKTNKCRTSRFQRFGTGIYCSSVSSKADDYVKCSLPDQSHFQSHPPLSSLVPIGSPCKVMIVCKVLIGRVYHSTKNLTHLNTPPNDYDSVQGVPGAVLNYDEIVVYDDCAILPHCIILYTTKA